MKQELCNQLWDLIQEKKNVDITLFGTKSYRITKNIEVGNRFPSGIRIISFLQKFPIKRTKYFQGEFMKYLFLGWCMTRLNIRELRLLITKLENLESKS